MPSQGSNAQNAMLSTGPRSLEGKVAVGRNATKHGAFSEAVLVLGEDPAAFEALHDGMVESLQPVGPLEEQLVGRMASLWWRTQRVGKVEREGLEYALRKHEATSTPSLVATCGVMAFGDGHHQERLLRYESQLERSFFRLLHELERIQARRKGDAVLPPVVMDVNLNGV